MRRFGRRLGSKRWERCEAGPGQQFFKVGCFMFGFKGQACWKLVPGCSGAHSKLGVRHVLKFQDLQKDAIAARLRCPTQGQEMQALHHCDADCSHLLRDPLLVAGCDTQNEG